MTIKKFDEIYKAMRAALVSKSDKLTNFNVNSALAAFLEAVANEGEALWFFGDTAYQACFITTAKGADLDKRAQEMGRERRAAQTATGKVTFTGDAETTIPAGTTVGTSSTPKVEFTTDAEVTIPVGETEVDADITCTQEGAIGNVEAGQIDTMVDTVPGITAVTNQQATTGGADEETDAELRARLVLAWYACCRGPTKDTIRSWCMEVEGVADAKIVPSFPEPGKAGVYVWQRNEAGSLVPAESALITAVQTKLDEYRPICFILTAMQPTGILVDVTIEIEIVESADFLTVRDNVQAAIETYFAGLSVGDDVLRAAIIAEVMDVTDCVNCDLLEPETDLEVGATETAMLGDVSIQEMS